MEHIQREKVWFNRSDRDCRAAISKGEHDKPLDVDTHWHDLFEAVKCHGCGKVIIEGREYGYGNGDIIIIPCKFLHGFKEPEKGEYKVIFICAENILSDGNADFAEKLKARMYGTFSMRFVFTTSDVKYPALDRAFENLYHSAEENKNPLKIRAGILNFLSETDYDENAPVQLNEQRYVLGEVAEFIEKNYAGEISLNDLCKIAAMSKFYFIKTFSRYYGTTPMRFVLNMRLKKAFGKLREGCPVTEAAFDCGFNNLSYFTRQFTKKYGILPKDVKNRSFSEQVLP